MRAVTALLWALIVVGLGAIAWWFIRGPFLPIGTQTIPAVVEQSATPVVSGAFAISSRNGSQVRWNPCDGPISVEINYGDLGEKERSAAKRAVAAGIKQTQAATGLEFVYSGATRDDFPTATTDARRKADNAIVIAFLPKGEALLREHSPNIVIKRTMDGDTSDGTGGADASPASPPPWMPIVGVDVQIATEDLAKPVAGTRQLVLTGLAAAAGLEQTPDATSDNVMALDVADGLISFGPGDLAGLAAVGADQGCIEPQQ